jgi:hypothetical protein
MGLENLGRKYVTFIVFMLNFCKELAGGKKSSQKSNNGFIVNTIFRKFTFNLACRLFFQFVFKESRDFFPNS